MSEPFTYAGAGVSLDAAEAIVARLAGAVRSTRTDGVVDAHGGFAGLFAIGDDLLVSGTDGVGTKMLLHREAGSLHAAGIDCVAMCVNDILCCGARPLFFLDYIAVGRLDPERVATIVEGVADGCRQAGAALLGGETAEHPGVMGDDDVDLAGFAVGIVRRDRLVDGRRVTAGDAIIGIASSGVHANGFSLVRTLLAHHGIPLAGAHRDLLAPTAIYARAVEALLAVASVRAMAHVTGGGVEGNLPRALPDGAGARIVLGSWPRPPVFDWIASLGVAEDEMLRVFNCGIGLLVVVAPGDVERAFAALRAVGATAWRVGEITGSGGVLLEP